MFLEEKITITGLYAFRYYFEKRKEISVNGRPHHALTFRLSGKVSIESGDKSIVSEAGSLTFVPQGLAYRTEIFEKGSAIGVHFTTAEQYDGLFPELLVPSYPKVFSNLFFELFSRYKAGRENDLYCMSMFYGILGEARHEYLKKYGKIIDPRVRKAKERIDREFSDVTLSVSSLAAELGISEVYFRQIFASSLGVSPSAYIKKVRIENAKAYLRTGLFSVTEVSMRCGFDSISYFSYEFHRTVGMKPKEYIEKLM